MSDEFHWLNPPANWSGDAGRLEFSTDAKTDFWRETFYGFVHDNGHAYTAKAALVPAVGQPRRSFAET